MLWHLLGLLTINIHLMVTGITISAQATLHAGATRSIHRNEHTLYTSLVPG
jgi:hypothetical protein